MLPIQKQVIHTDNGKEFVNLCYDSKYKGTRYESLTREEFELTKTVVSDNALCPLMTRYTLSS